jgi:ABC-type phosphate transport system substrate-binding protein
LRVLTKLVAGATVAAAAAMFAVTPALADPPSGTTPKPADVVGVGSDTIQNVLDQFSHDYNAKHTGTKLYSWDATNPRTAAIHDSITLKKGCPKVTRPDGSSEGITALSTGLGGKTSGHPCEDFARSSRDRATTDPGFHKGGIAFVTLAGDAVTWSTQKTTNAPSNLSTAQLTKIYTCQATRWNQVGGTSTAKIRAFIPQTGSGTRAFFLSALGLVNPGSCVSDDGGKLEENEGVNPVLDSKNAIFPYSIGKYIAEKFHSANCLNSTCTPVSGKVCKPASGQNLFGCDTHGTMVLHSINHTKPTLGTGKSTTINPAFTPAFVRTLFDVVRYSTATGNVNHIPPYLVKFFGPKGWICTNKTAHQDLLNYGFITLKTCGSTH